MEHRRDPVLEERPPGPIKYRIGERPPIHEPGGDHGGSDAALAEGAQLMLEPVDITQGDVTDGMQAASPVAARLGCPTVQSPHVGESRGEVTCELSLSLVVVVWDAH